MDAQRFLADFGHIAGAPRGVERLRQLVLHLAVSGDLVQMDKAVDATPLLEAIAEQKRIHPEQNRVVAKQRPVPLTAIKAPQHWAVCRLGDLALTITGGGTPSKNNPGYWGGKIPWASVKDLKGLKFLDETEDHITEEGLKNSSSNLIPAGRVIVCTRMGLGKIAINRVEMAINQDLKALELPPDVNPEFFLILYQTREVEGTGTTVAGIRQEQLLDLPGALPPLEEQSRIVAKVDELMALCDQMEKQYQDRRKLQNVLRLSILKSLVAARSSHELQTSWARLKVNFGQLFSAPDDVSEIRDVIFDFALRGVFLSTTLINQLGEFSSEGLGPLPVGWQWRTLSELSEHITSGSRGWRAFLASTGDAFIRSQDIKHDTLIFENPAYVILPEKAEGKRTLVQHSDLLLTITGGNVGKCAIVPKLPYRAFVSQHVALIRLKDASLSEFIHYWMINTYGGRRFLSRYIYGDKPGLNLAQVGSVPVPIPPAAVLPQILDGLKAFQKICDRLSEQLDAERDISTALSTAAIASLTGVTAEQVKDEPMRAPETELIATLRLGVIPDARAQAPLATLLFRHKGEMSPRDLWQRFGGEIDEFYAQLKTEVERGWIVPPGVAEMREKFTETATA